MCQLALQYLYRAMDFLVANHDEMGEALLWNTASLSQLATEPLCLDTTSLHGESDGEDEEPQQGSQAAGARATRRCARGAIPRTVGWTRPKW